MPEPRIGVEVLQGPDALAHHAAQQLVATAAEAVRASGRFTLALSGGNTPRPLYALLASREYATALDWARTHVCWSDERCVPPDDPASNYRMVREALLDHVPLPPANIHRIEGEAEPTAAAARYERELRALLRTPTGPPARTPPSRFDLVLLGLGADGHTASLFPGLTAVRERKRWVAAEYVAAMSMWRVTLTPLVINAAAEVWFLVCGRDKAPMVRSVLDGPSRPEWLPAQAIAPTDGRLRWMLDAGAAEELR